MMNNNHIFHYTELDLIVTGQNKTKKKKKTIMYALVIKKSLIPYVIVKLKLKLQ